MWLQTTIGGAGRLSGDLTGPAAAALTAVLAALGAKGGPEDTRTLVQRQHDALAEACQRLIDSGMLPGHDSQPAQLTVHVDLAELRGQPAASGLEAGWSTARAAAAQIPGSACLTGPEAAAAACDAALTPVVSGHLDRNVLDQLTGVFLDTLSHRNGPYSSADGQFPELSELTRERLQHTLLSWSIDLLSGPGRVPRLPAPPPAARPVHQLVPAAGPRPHHPGRPPAPAQSRHPAGQKMPLPGL